MDNEIDTFYRCVDNAQLINRLWESALEELFVERLDDGLLAFQVVYLSHILAHVLVKILECRCFLVHLLAFQHVQHALHTLAHGVVGGEMVFLKQRFEHRPYNHVLRQHLNGLLCRNRGVEVLLQHMQEGFKLFLVHTRLDKLPDAINKLLGNVANLSSPVLPIQPVANLFHHFGIDAILQFAKPERELGSHVLIGELCEVVLIVVMRGLRITSQHLERPTWHASHNNFGRPLLIQTDFVDRGVKLLVVGTEGIENVPYHLKSIVVVEYKIRFGVGRNHHGNDDVPVFLRLVGCRIFKTAHHTSHTLHHVYLTIARRCEDYGVECRHIHPFGQASHIA